MKALRLTYFALALAFFAWVPAAAHGRVFHSLNYMSDAQAQEFLDEVRKGSAQAGSFWTFKVKLFDPTNMSNKKFGEVVFAPTKNEKVFFMKFDGAGCVLSNGVLQNDKGSTFEIDKPLYQDLIVSPRDLSFIFADDVPYSYIGPAKVASRSVQQFIRQTDFRIGDVKFSNVKISVDEKFMVVLQVDCLIGRRKVARRVSVSSFKNFDGNWFPRIIEISDTVNHRRAKLEILSVEVND